MKEEEKRKVCVTDIAYQTEQVKRRKKMSECKNYESSELSAAKSSKVQESKEQKVLSLKNLRVFQIWSREKLCRRAPCKNQEDLELKQSNIIIPTLSPPCRLHA
jgi:hypothetical protein